MLRKLSLFVVSAVLLAACQTQPQNPSQNPPPKPEVKPTGMQTCKFRPEVCTMQYEPVCGFDQAGRQLQTYGNACSACVNTEVHSFTPGECNGSASQ